MPTTSKEIRVCSLSGSFFYRRKMIDAIERQLQDSELYQYDDNATAEDIQMEILGSSLFNSNKLVVLRQLLRFAKGKQAEQWINILSNIPSGTVVVLNGVLDNSSSSKAGTASSESKNCLTPESSRKVIKHVKKIGNYFEDSKFLKYNEANKWLIERLKSKNLSCNSSDLSLILRSVGNQSGLGYDVDRLFLIVEKLTSYLGKKKNVQRNDLIAISDSLTSYFIWDIVNALDDKDLSRCMFLVKVALNGSSGTAQSVVSEVLTVFSNRFHLLLLVKDCLQQGLDNSEIVKWVGQLTRLNKDSGNGLSRKFTTKSGSSMYSAKYTESVTKSYYGRPSIVSRYSMKHIIQIIRCCDEALYKIRQGTNTAEALLMIDNFLMTCFSLLSVESLSLIRNVSDVIS